MEKQVSHSEVHPSPLVAFETYVTHEALCGLTVHYLDSPAQLLAGEHVSIPLIMRPELARELARALLVAASLSDGGPNRSDVH